MALSLRKTPNWANWLILVVYLFFCALMAQITLQYIPFNSDTAFLRIKQDVVDISWYLPAFYVHAWTAIFVLLAGFTQFSPFLRKKFPRVHRKMGWLYALVILVLAGPSGFLIGLHANGGWASQLAFILLAVGWMIFTGMAVWRAKQGKWLSHRDWMIRSFALTLSAITLRAWKFVIVLLIAPRPMDVYQIVAWLGWGLNLLIAEILIYKLHKK